MARGTVASGTAASGTVTSGTAATSFDQRGADQPSRRDAGGVLRVLALIAVALGLAALTAAACVLSYQSIHVLAGQAGVSDQLARIYPGIFDALLVVSGCSVLALRGAGLPSKIYAWFCLIVLLAALAAGGVVHAAGYHIPLRPAEITAAIVPFALVLLGFGLLLALLRHARLRRSRQRPDRPVGVPDLLALTSSGAPQSAAAPQHGQEDPATQVALTSQARTAATPAALVPATPAATSQNSAGQSSARPETARPETASPATTPGVTRPRATPGNATPGNATPGNASLGNASLGNASPENASPGNASPEVAAAGAGRPNLAKAGAGQSSSGSAGTVPADQGSEDIGATTVRLPKQGDAKQPAARQTDPEPAARQAALKPAGPQQAGAKQAETTKQAQTQPPAEAQPAARATQAAPTAPLPAVQQDQDAPARPPVRQAELQLRARIPRPAPASDDATSSAQQAAAPPPAADPSVQPAPLMPPVSPHAAGPATDQPRRTSLRRFRSRRSAPANQPDYSEPTDMFAADPGGYSGDATENAGYPDPDERAAPAELSAAPTPSPGNQNTEPEPAEANPEPTVAETAPPAEPPALERPRSSPTRPHD